ncbi:MAG: SRPBCC family protein [Nitriliruptoraceae bacterium]|nr:SRPBCC family protein [Nitriliruptoraceae bacterium]
MPDTTQTTTVERPIGEVFALVEDFSRLPEWDPTFDAAHQVDDGPIGIGTVFATTGSVLGASFDLELEVVAYDAPARIAFRGTGDGLRTREDLTLEATEDGTRVTYDSAFETDLPNLVDALTDPAFSLVGARVIRSLRDWLTEQPRGDDARSDT